MKLSYARNAGWLPVILFSIFTSCSSDVEPVVKQEANPEKAASGKDAAAGRLPNGLTVSVFGGGPIYKNRSVTIPELKASGFTEVVVWNIAVSTAGDLNFNGEFPVASNGTYIGGNMYPNFASDLQSLKTGTTSVNRVTLSIGSSNVGDFQHIRDLINAQGTGSTSILYRNFQALKAATGADAIDLDDENCYNQSTMVQFCVMLGQLGYTVALCPYTNSSFWTSVASQVNTQRPGTIDQVHLQCYAGGGGNSPCNWNFGGIPVHGSRWSGSTSSVQSQFTTWKNACGTTGGWMWLYDEWVGNGMAAQYATAIRNGLGGTTPATGVKFFQHANYTGASTSLIAKGNYTLSQLQALGFVNDWASSVQIPSGWTVICYQHDNFGGTAWTLNANNANFTTITGLNDQVSSVKIQ